jgi:multicomponent Na+:H+ antiporter subunit B
MTREVAAVLFTAGLGFLLLVVASQLDYGQPPMVVGQEILDVAPEQVGAANIVTSVLLAYRCFDTLGELSVLFAAATAANLALGYRRSDAPTDPEAGFILRAGADLLFPLLLVVGIYIVLHGHLSPGGGFQGGVILAAAFFVGVLGRPSEGLNYGAIVWIEGLAGAGFIGIGLWALLAHGEFLKPMGAQGTVGDLISAGTLPWLSVALGLKVGSELAGLMASLSEAEAREP